MVSVSLPVLTLFRVVDVVVDSAWDFNVQLGWSGEIEVQNGIADKAVEGLSREAIVPLIYITRDITLLSRSIRLVAGHHAFGLLL